MQVRGRALAAVLILVASPALAHTGIGDADGFGHGFAHPLGGLDHVLAMAAVGLLAAQLGGRALWAVPAAFLGMMVVGGALGTAGVTLPRVETGIALSLVAFGTAIALSWPLATGAAMALVGAFAIFHGHAHGAEMPETASGIAYGAGFVLATALLHAAGIAAGLALGRSRVGTGPVRLAGGLTALAGLGLLVGIV